MPFTLVAFKETQAAATLANIAGLADPHVRVAGDDIYVPDALPFLAAYYVLGNTGISQARIESPSLRRLANIDVVPFDIGTEPGTPAAFVTNCAAPKALEGSEGLNLKATFSPSCTVLGLMWLSDGPIAPVAGEIFTIKANASGSCVAYTWTNMSITFETALPRGRYQIVGMRVKSATVIAARLVIPGYAWRPGCIGSDAYTDLEWGDFRKGKMGVWGEFDHDLPPTVDFLAVSTDSNPEVWLDLIKIS